MNQVMETRLLETSAMAQVAVAMNAAMLQTDVNEARLRAQLLLYHATAAHDTELARVTTVVVRLLGPRGSLPKPGCGMAMLAVSARLNERFAFSD